MSTVPTVDVGKERRMVAPVAQRYIPRNPLTRWDVSSIPANGISLTKKKKTKKKTKK